MNDRDRELMIGLARHHQALRPLIGAQPVQYLDIPAHENIGDQLIYLGTLRFLRNSRIHVSAISSLHNYAEKRDNSVLLLHGGGNLGDLYEWHQLFRERIIAENPHRRVIVLPQSIHFLTKENFIRAQRVMSSHPDLYLCARDERSLKIAQQLCRHTLLLPDMAHQLYPILRAPSTAPHLNILYLRRTDDEATQNIEASLLETDIRTDWPELVGHREGRRIRRSVRILKTLTKAGLATTTTKAFSMWWEHESNQLAHRAIRLFSKYDRVVTDRLHAHILACLMDMPNAVYDNKYGKNSGYIRTWTSDSSLTRLATE